MTDDVTTLQRVKDMITTVNGDLNSYQPVLAIIVTWSNARLRETDSEEVSSTSTPIDEVCVCVSLLLARLVLISLT